MAKAFNRAIIDRKIEVIRRCLKRVQEKTPASAAALAKDPDAQDIVLINLERAVQAAVDIGAQVLSQEEIAPPETLAGVFDALERATIVTSNVAERMRKAVGFRNIAVHEYENLDLAIVFAIATRHLTDFQAFVQAIDNWLTVGP